MPRGVRINWTRENLEAAERVDSEESARALGDQIGATVATVYSMKARLTHEGIDEVLRRQSERNAKYTSGGGAQPRTAREQLARVYNITGGNAGRGGAYAQFNVTLPRSVAEAWVAKWGSQIRYVPTEDGLLIVPVVPPPAPELPTWLADGDEPS